MWHAETGNKTAELSCEHVGPVQCVQFNPKYMLLASACNSMVQIQVVFPLIEV